MAIQSTQYAGVVGVPRVKVAPTDNGNSDKVLFATTPATYAAQAVNEIFDIGFIPAGSRILPTGALECAAGAASSTLSIGLRRASTGAVISATQIASAVNLTAAGVKALNNGAGFAGAGYVTPEDVIVYGTFTGATNTANQAISVYLPFVPAGA
jgi:hypothetical protein